MVLDHIAEQADVDESERDAKAAATTRSAPYAGSD